MASEPRAWWTRAWDVLHSADLWRTTPMARAEAVIDGTKADDHLVGTDEDDFINGRRGADTLVGGLGNDVYIVDNAGDVVEELAGEGLDTVRAGVSHTLAANVEQLKLTGTDNLSGTGNEADNLLEGNGGNNELFGLEGVDTLTGNAGHDTLDGGSGADELAGGSGDDTYFVDDQDDRTIEWRNGGIDTVVATVDWKLAKNTEHLILAGGPSDGLRGIGNALDNVIAGDIGENYIDGGAGNDTITGGTALSPGASDTLIGGEGDDDITAASGGFEGGALYGGTGNDTLRATSATLYGEDGDDLLYGGPGWGHHATGNSVYGGAGNDTIEGGGQLFGGDGNDLMSTDTGAQVEAGLGDDTLSAFGGSGFTSFYIDMGAGNDNAQATAINNGLTILGGEGNDSLTGTGYNGLLLDGGAGDDVVNGWASAGGPDFTVRGGDGNDVVNVIGRRGIVEGGTGDDVLISDGDSMSEATLQGGEGNDTLIGRSDRSQLEGGDGLDTFVLLAKEILPYEATWVMDFSSIDDTLSVSQTTLAAGDGDLEVEGATTITGPGGFDASAELVLLAEDIVGPLTLDAVAAALGEANQAYTTGQTSVFVVGDGTETWVLHFTSSGDDAAISAAELSVVGRVAGGVNLATEDIVWGP